MVTRFPLARLLRLRQMAEDTAAQNLAMAQRREVQADSKAVRAQEGLFGSKIGGECSATVWTAVIAARTASIAMLGEANAAVAAAQADTADQLDQFHHAKQVAASLEKLETGFTVALRAEQERAQGLELDEIGQNLFTAKTGDNRGL